MKDATGELHVTAIQALLEVASDAPEQCAGLYRGQLSWLRSFLTHTDATGKLQSNFMLQSLLTAVSIKIKKTNGSTIIMQAQGFLHLPTSVLSTTLV